jgi:hypothetical protein
MNLIEAEEVSEELDGQNDLKEPAVILKRKFDEVTQNGLVIESSQIKHGFDNDDTARVSNESSVNTKPKIDSETVSESCQIEPESDDVTKRQKLNDILDDVVDRQSKIVIEIHKALFFKDLPFELTSKCSMIKCEVCLVDLVSPPGSFFNHVNSIRAF